MSCIEKTSVMVCAGTWIDYSGSSGSVSVDASVCRVWLPSGWRNSCSHSVSSADTTLSRVGHDTDTPTFPSALAWASRWSQVILTSFSLILHDQPATDGIISESTPEVRNRSKSTQTTHLPSSCGKLIPNVTHLAHGKADSKKDYLVGP